ncbi:MAG: phospholipid carrier-dependent glycosyltransferase [Abitibacteriaceae bacterium]|nr:phospholipid carrier-dependent glycosyltransferase [Abditibacteriaceae bacterium]
MAQTTRKSKRKKQALKTKPQPQAELNGLNGADQTPVPPRVPPAAPAPAPSEQTTRATQTPLQTAITLGLYLLIALGIACRFVGVLGWDEGAHLHPDERFLTMTVPKLQWPTSVGDYFDTANAPLNPFNREVNFFVYGQLPLNIVKAVAALLATLQPHWPAPARLLMGDNYDGVLYVGRFLSALFDAGTVVLVYCIGKRLGGNRLGSLAAALLGFIALHIQQSHFFVVDTFATFFIAAAFLAAMGKSQHELDTGVSETPTPDTSVATKRGFTRTLRSFKSVFWAGVWCGAAIACKISAVLFLPILVSLVTVQWRRTAPTNILSKARPVLLLLATVFITFRVLHPIAFTGTPSPLTLGGLLDIRPLVKAEDVANSHLLQVLQGDGLVVVRPNPVFWGSVREQQAISTGETDLVWNLQWVGHANYFWPLRNLMLWAVGWPLMLCGMAGMGLIFWNEVRRRSLLPGLHATAWWTFIVFVYYARWYSKFTRYYLLLTPFLALCAAYFLLEFWRFARKPDKDQQPYWRWAAWGLSSGVVGFTALWAIAVTSIYTRPHTRMEASRWMRQNIAPGTPVANETAWDDSLPWGDTGGLKMLNLELYDRDNAQKRQKLLDLLDQTQWLVISSNRVWGTVPRLPQRWPMTTAYYHALFSGQLGFKLVQEFTSYPQLNLLGLNLQFPDDTVEEALTVYDHPRVLLFHKDIGWSRDNAARLLDPALLSQASDKTLTQIREEGWRPDENSLPWPPRLPAHNNQ